MGAININIVSWNIADLGKHVNNMEFKSFLNAFDIIHLCETWGKCIGEFSNLLQSYICHDSVRPFNPGNIRNSGGISVFIKSNLQKLNIISRIKSCYNDCVVLYCKFSILFKSKDIIMYYTYVSPEGSHIYNCREEKNGILYMFSNLEELKFEYPNALIFLSGDFKWQVGR